MINAGVAASSTTVDDMQSLLQKCDKLSIEVKTKLVNGWNGKWSMSSDPRTVEGCLDLTATTQSKITDNMVSELAQCLSLLGDGVKNLNLSNNCLTSAGISELIGSFKKSNAAIQKISLHMNNLDDSCMKTFGEYIQSNSFLKHLSLRYNQISDLGVDILASYLHGNTTLKSLDLTGNAEISEASNVSLIKMIESSHIEFLIIHKVIPLSMDVDVFAIPLELNKLKNGSKLLNVRKNHANDHDVSKICDVMRSYGIHNLKEVVFDSENITTKGVIELCNTLRACDSYVIELLLNLNQMEDSCMKQVGEFVKDNKYLERLFVSSTKITDRGIEILSEYLMGNITLKSLSLGDNMITDTSVPILVDLAKSSNLTQVFLLYTSITEERKQELREVLRIPVEKREIPIQSNTKSAAKIKSIV